MKFHTSGEKNDKQFKRIGRKMGNLVAVMLGVSITVVVLVCVLMFYNLTMSLMQDVCVRGTNVLAYELQSYDGDDDKTALLDALKENMDCEFTIFHGDERAYTTIQQNGQRAVGTRLSSDIADKVLKQGQSYVGYAKILGEKHLCSYVPTYGPNGQVDGLIFAGISMSKAYAHMNFTVLLACLAALACIIVGIWIVSVYIKRTVSMPLFRLTVLAQTFEKGDLGLNQHQTMMADVESNDEIGVLSQSFDRTICRLRNYIGEIADILERIANGDLNAQTTQDYVGDFASIQTSLNDILQRLNETMGQIVNSSKQVADGADQMSNVAQALSQGAMEQSTSVDELARTMQVVTGHIKQTAANAQQTQQQTEDMGRRLTESNQKMQEMIAAMQEMTDSSNAINMIVKTIDDIAFQTNILALNAAVEAARAGEAGKGFSVVADEVRNLAGKSAEASQYTTTLIERSMNAVDKGTQIVDVTAKQLEDVVNKAQGIVSTINNIAVDARDQADTIEQVQAKIDQISSVVQNNSATSEESAATSEELRAQAGILKQLVNTFNLR